MPSFDCKLATMDKLSVGPRGIKEPLCNNCVQPDCDNPIRKQSVYVLGNLVDWRLWIVNNSVRQVVQCSGYLSGDSDESMGSYVVSPRTTSEGSEDEGPEGRPT